MTDDRMSGVALLAGQAGLILTLSLHPSGPMSQAQIDQLVHRLIYVHSLGLATVPIMVLGALGLSRALSSPNRLSVVAFVLYGFAAVAMFSGIVVDGFVTPSLLRQVAGASEGGADFWRRVLRYNAFVDVALLQVSLVATATAIVAWSVGMLRITKFNRAAATYGLIIGVLAAIAVFSGSFGAEHAIGVVLLGQSTWFVLVGVLLCRLRT
jgi:hypothetical protein